MAARPGRIKRAQARRRAEREAYAQRLATMTRAYMPHCDQAILHAPGACEYCDHYPDWQELRALMRINFTGESDPHKAPCPSLWFRSAEVRDRWGGNVPKAPPVL